MSIVFRIKPSLTVIPCGIFPYDVMVIFGGYNKRMEKRVKPYVRKEYLPKIRENLQGTNHGRTVRTPNGVVITHFRVDPSPGLIAHEVFHAADFLMNYIENPLSDTNDETYAYLIGHITDGVYDHMKGHRKKGG